MEKITRLKITDSEDLRGMLMILAYNDYIVWIERKKELSMSRQEVFICFMKWPNLSDAPDEFIAACERHAVESGDKNNE